MIIDYRQIGIEIYKNSLNDWHYPAIELG